ncbi:MAG TPA: hypothetical protein VHK91_11730 [Flavisolibacter sp.]|jgi:hypothetical protein|nr:hypothetical protein [Flavisolibacter sp.]
MKYKFPASLEMNYAPIAELINEGEELSKQEVLEKCAGQIDFTLLQQVKELEFEIIGKNSKGELYLK